MTKKTDNQSANEKVSATETEVAPTEAAKMWEEIKNLPIQMFGLPDQIVAQHCSFVPVEPTSLYVTIRSSAALPSLEATIGPRYTVELVDRFVIIRRAPAPLFPAKKR